MSLPFPQSKNHLLSVVENLTYTERFNYASRLGRDYKGKPALRALVDDLLKHPDPPVPEMEAEEGFTEILPAQRTSIAKYYNEDQLALAIAVSAGMFDIIKARLTSPSTFFDSLVFTSFIRMKRDEMQVDSGKKGAPDYYASAADVIAAILAAVPARRRLLIQETIQAKRLDIIVQVVPQLKALPNYSKKNVAHIIHACSTETVKDFLFENKYQQAGEVWNKIIKFHVMGVLDLLQEDLEVSHPLHRGSIYYNYQSWAFSASKTVPRFLRNKPAMARFLDIVHKFPTITSNPPPGERESSEPGKSEIGLPQLLISNAREFMRVWPEKTTQCFKLTAWLHYDGTMHYDSGVGQLALTLNPSYKYVNEYIEHVLSITPPELKLSKAHQHYKFIKMILDTGYSTNKWNTYQTRYLTKVIAKYMVDRRPDITGNTYHEWSTLWSSALSQALTCYNGKLEARRSDVAAEKEKEKEKKKAYYKKQQEKYRKAIIDTLHTFHPLYFEGVYRGLRKADKDYEIRKINLTLDSYVSTVLHNIRDAKIAMHIFELNRESLLSLLKYGRQGKPEEKQDKIRRAYNFVLSLVSNFTCSVNAEPFDDDKSFAKKARDDMFHFIDKNFEELSNDEIRTLFNTDVDLTYKLFFPRLQADPLEAVSFVVSIFAQLNKDQQIAVYKWFTLENLVHMAQNSPGNFVSIIRLLPINVINEAVMHLLTNPKLVDENTRNQLVSFQDINDIKIRNGLQKMSNSNNVAERNGALQSLAMATARSSDENQAHRTLKFVREKIKNESKENRGNILELVQEHFVTPVGVKQYQFAYWNDMLSDALESPDLDSDVYDKSSFVSHPVLKFFDNIVTSGIVSCTKEAAKDFDPAVFESCVEMLWRLVVFRHGEKKAAQEEFIIPCSDMQSSTGDVSEEQMIASQRKLIPIYLAAYEKRIAEKNPDWKTNFKYYSQFFNQDTWFHIPELVEISRAQITRIKSEATKDDDGLYVIPSDDVVRKLLGFIKNKSKLWNEAPVAEIVDLIMHSRLVPSLLKHWVAWKEEGAKKPREFKARKDKYILELLKISPSAIHLRFVWRHLVTYMQNKLDDYIGKRKTFRGVFYVGPDKRKFDRSCIKTPETKRSGGRARAKPAGKARRQTNAGNITTTAGTQQEVDEEREKEKKIREELEDTPEEFWDHEDFFYLEACWGLQRLLPRQVNVLAKDWEVQALSSDRAVPYKVKCMARWTVMPTVTYNDIVVFLNANETATTRHNGLSVNLIEALLRGVMRNDEPTAPLNFLLSPKFLSSDRSRVSVYAISQSIPYMPPDGLTSMLKLCLTGKRRQQLKISSYKEIIRLLTLSPTDEHLDIIFREWKRPDLHRDVRIAILISAMKFLHSKDERFNKIAWRILEHGATLSDQHEILAALLGTSSESVGLEFSVAGDTTFFRNSRISEHLNDLSKHTIPSEHTKRYGEKVVSVIATTAKNDDIKFIAIGALANWEINDILIDLTFKYLADFSPESLLYSEIPSERNIFQHRWTRLVSTFVHNAIACTERCDKVIELADILCSKISSTPPKERKNRIILLDLAKELLGTLPIPKISNNQYKDGEEEELIDVFKMKLGNVFALKIFERRLTQLKYLVKYNNLTKSDEFVSLLHDITAFAATYPTVADTFYASSAADILASTPEKSEVYKKLFALKIDPSNSPVSSTPEYLYLLRRVALNRISADISTCYHHTEITFQFWQDLFEFAEQRKDIPREHVKASQIFDFGPLVKSIGDNLKYSVTEVRHTPPVYPATTLSVIKRIAARYLEVLQGKKTDAFAEKVGRYLIEKTKVLTEPLPVEELCQISHNLIRTTRDATSLIPKIMNDLYNANRVEDSVILARKVVQRKLSADSDADAFYLAQAPDVALAVIEAGRYFAQSNQKIVEAFILDVIANLNECELPKGVHIMDRVSQLARCVEVTCGYDAPHDVANESAKRLMKIFIPKYVEIPREEARELTPEELAIQCITVSVLKGHPRWIVEYHQRLISLYADAMTQDASIGVIARATAIDMLVALGNAFPNADSFNISHLYISYFSDVIHLHPKARDTPRNKKYIEITFDLAETLMKQHPSLIVHDRNLSLKFLNWAVSMYIREPDVNAILQQVKNTCLNDNILPPQKDLKEADIKNLVAFIDALINLKHKELILPQQTLLPQHSLPQYTHISQHLAFNMVRKFGGTLRETKEREYVWRDDFVALLDEICDLPDPNIKAEAWITDTVYPK